MKEEKFYITTAIDYPSGPPHVGHLYEKICADVLARWNRALGKKTFFLTGTDEHGRKIQRAAKKAAKPIPAFLDKQVALFKQLCDAYDISHDRFIRTTEKQHYKVSQELFQRAIDNGDIYKDLYQGLYCTDCEAYYNTRDLKNGKCPVHGTLPEEVEEESYFFKMSRYQEALIKHIEENPDFILPRHRGKEILNRLKDGLKDLSVSRATFKWGVPLPNDQAHVMYVWFDALINYVTGANWGEDEEAQWWPATLHLIGKDILWFHTVIWGSILLSTKLPLPKHVFAHGFIKTAEGKKMAKSTGTVIDPIALAEQYPVDAIRYYLCKEVPFGEDGFFSEEGVVTRYNQELANDLGNLLNRVLVLVEKNFDGIVPEAEPDPALYKKLDQDAIFRHMEKFELHRALIEIMAFVKNLNSYVNEKKVWELEGKEQAEVLYSLCDGLALTAELLAPFMPQTAVSIRSQLGIEATGLQSLKPSLLKPGTRIQKQDILFPKLEVVQKEIPALTYSVEEGIEKELQGVVLEINHLNVQKRSGKLERAKKQVLAEQPVEPKLKGKELAAFSALMGTKDGGEKPAPQLLYQYVQKTGHLPNINTVADTYNLLSYKTGIVMGAYDREAFHGGIYLAHATGKESFTPLGAQQPVIVKKGEYLYVDYKGHVITRLISKQEERVKIQRHTTHAAAILQGNKEISHQTLLEAAKELAQLLKEVAGADCRVVEPKHQNQTPRRAV